MKVPNLYGVTQKRWLLIDGSYHAVHEDDETRRFVDHLIGFLPVFGTAVDRSIDEAPRLAKVIAFLRTLSPPPFPGPIDPAASARGAALYERRCAGCHGDKGADGAYRYPGRRVPVEEIGTDATRARALTPDLLRRFADTDVGKYEIVQSTGTYMPPSLHGVWANAPYFHNASVPTLWHVLTPSERPVRFLTGGHAFDPRRVGIACGVTRESEETCVYFHGYVPWSEPRVYDTREPGRSNRGHEQPVSGLTDAMKWDLIEYLKGL